MAYYCERGCERPSVGRFTYANGETESICKSCLNDHISKVVHTAIQNGVVRSAEGAKQLESDTWHRITG